MACVRMFLFYLFFSLLLIKLDTKYTIKIPFLAIKLNKACSEPGSIKHGTVTGLKQVPLYEEGEQLTLSCDQGYSLTDGTDSINCLANGYWDGVLASCIR